MNIKNTLRDFLYDKNYFITLYDNDLYIYSYENIEKISDSLIIIRFTNFLLEISGIKLKIYKMNREELLIKGSISSLGKKYE